jgi:hypothetical protein
MEIGYVAKDAKWREVVQERTAEEFDVGYYRKLLEKAWDEVSFVSKRIIDQIRNVALSIITTKKRILVLMFYQKIDSYFIACCSQT